MFTELSLVAEKVVKRGPIKTDQNYQYAKLGMIGHSDVAIGDELMDVRCGAELYIKHYIQMLLANFCWKGLFKSTSHIINPIKGVEYTVSVGVSRADMWKVLNIVADKCNLRFTDLHVVFDLETTGLIDHNAGKKGMPEIVQIAMREYETGMCIYSHHNRPTKPLTKFIQEYVGVTDKMLRDKPDISKTRTWLATQLRNVTDLTMYAHNGTRFDAILMEHYQLIPMQIGVVWRDSIPLIRSHYNGTIKDCNLGAVYKQFFNQAIHKQHSAMADVDALIRIMRFLGIGNTPLSALPKDPQPVPSATAKAPKPA